MLATDNRMSQAFIFDTSNPLLDVDGLVRSGCGGNDLRAGVFGDGIDLGDEGSITIRVRNQCGGLSIKRVPKNTSASCSIHLGLG